MDNEPSGNGNQYDYGFRIYNPRIAKFLSVDPLTKSYPMLTPFQFASNTPIWAVDRDGQESTIYIRDADWAAKIAGLLKDIEHVTSEKVQQMVVEATYSTMNWDNPQNEGMDRNVDEAAVQDANEGDFSGTRVYYHGELIAITPYYQGERLEPEAPKTFPDHIGQRIFNDVAGPILVNGHIGMLSIYSGGGLTTMALKNWFVSSSQDAAIDIFWQLNLNKYEFGEVNILSPAFKYIPGNAYFKAFGTGLLESSFEFSYNNGFRSIFSQGSQKIDLSVASKNYLVESFSGGLKLQYDFNVGKYGNTKFNFAADIMSEGLEQAIQKTIPYEP